MGVKDIVYVVFLVVGVIGYIVTTALAIKRKKTSGVSKKEFDSFIESECNVAIDYIKKVEAKYASVFKEGVKAGEFKLKDVLDLIKEDCESKGVSFTKSVWEKFIGNVVSAMNLGKADCSEQSTQVDGVSAEINELQGVQVTR